MIIRLTTLLLVFAIAAGCGDGDKKKKAQKPAEPVKYSLELEAKDPNQNPIAKVPVKLDGKVVGFTNEEGEFKGRLTETPGKTVTLTVGELEGYRFVGKTSLEEELRVTKVGKTISGMPIFLQVTAESVRKEYLVWIRANCDESIKEACFDMPVSLNGNEVARTNGLGYAHFSFADVPQNDIEVSIDTPDGSGDSANLEPSDPTYKITLDLDSHIYLVEEDFVDPAAVAKKKKARKATRRRANRKAAKKKAQKKAEPEPEPEPAGGINLFD